MVRVERRDAAGMRCIAPAYGERLGAGQDSATQDSGEVACVKKSERWDQGIYGIVSKQHVDPTKF